MEKGVEFRYRWHDSDVVNLRVTACNDRFAGQTNLYVGTDVLAEEAEKLKGFPCNPSDSREMTLGAFGAEFAGGAARFRFRCRDLAGHAEVEIMIEADCDREATPESVTLIASIEAAAIDIFVEQLMLLESEQGRALLGVVNAMN